MSKVYIAGKITGTEDYIERFSKAEAYLNDNGYQGRVVNPAKINAGLPPESTSYQDYIHIGLSMLRTCDTIYMLKGWEESRGASLELQYAITLDYQVLYEEEVSYGDGI